MTLHEIRETDMTVQQPQSEQELRGLYCRNLISE